jgi:hypothetical protein
MLGLLSLNVSELPSKSCTVMQSRNLLSMQLTPVLQIVSAPKIHMSRSIKRITMIDACPLAPKRSFSRGPQFRESAPIYEPMTRICGLELRIRNRSRCSSRSSFSKLHLATSSFVDDAFKWYNGPACCSGSCTSCVIFASRNPMHFLSLQSTHELSVL